MLRRNFLSNTAMQLAALAAAKPSAGSPSSHADGPIEADERGLRVVEPGTMSGLSFPGRERLRLDGEWE